MKAMLRRRFWGRVKKKSSKKFRVQSEMRCRNSENRIKIQKFVSNLYFFFQSRIFFVLGFIDPALVSDEAVKQAVRSGCIGNVGAYAADGDEGPSRKRARKLY